MMFCYKPQQEFQLQRLLYLQRHLLYFLQFPKKLLRYVFRKLCCQAFQGKQSQRGKRKSKRHEKSDILRHGTQESQISESKDNSKAQEGKTGKRFFVDSFFFFKPCSSPMPPDARTALPPLPTCRIGTDILRELNAKFKGYSTQLRILLCILKVCHLFFY